MKYVFLIVFFLFSHSLMSLGTKEIINKAIICTEVNNNFKSMYGFNFIDEVSVQILIKNSDTVDVLTDNILKYNLTKEIIYICDHCI